MEEAELAGAEFKSAREPSRELSDFFAKIDRELHAWVKRYTKLRGISQRQFIEERIREFMKRVEGEEDMDSLEEVEREERYEHLKNAHIKLVNEVNKLQRLLKKMKVYGKLVKFAVSLGLDTNKLSNLEELTPTMIEKWSGLQEEIHLFITLLESVKKKKEIEFQLASFRTN